MHQIADCLYSSQRREQVARLAKVGLLSLLVVAAGLFLGSYLWADHSGLPGGITCTQCREHFDEYSRHLTDGTSMDQDLADRVYQHLVGCTRCREAFEQQYPGLLLQVQRLSDLTIVSQVYFSLDNLRPLDNKK